jgi:hypothetical protein
MLILGSLFYSCTYYIAPAYTSVDELSKVRKGMTMSKVNEVLGIQPFDIYTVQDDGGTILVYNYRLKDRRAKVNGNLLEYTKTEASQKEGTPWYGEASRAYLLFKDDKMASLITDNGRQDAERLIIVNNNLQLISKEDLVNISYNHAGMDVLMLNKDGGVSRISVTKKGTKAAENMKRSVRLPQSIENSKEQTTEQGMKGGKSTNLDDNGKAPAWWDK